MLLAQPNPKSVHDRVRFTSDFLDDVPGYTSRLSFAQLPHEHIAHGREQG